jgi:transcriptional regulator
MHPNPVFRLADDAALRSFISEHAFAHLFVPTPGGPRVAHVPLTLADAGCFRFHVSRSNAVAKALDGARVVASVAGPHGYVSPDWYAEPLGQVPTWNYTAVEIEGECRALDDLALIDQLGALASAHEGRLAPKPQWTLEKLPQSKLHAMCGGIQAFELRVTDVRGTAKLGQNKSAADRAGTVLGLQNSGNVDLADAMRVAAQTRADHHGDGKPSPIRPALRARS